MKLYIGSDHNGYEYKEKLADFLQRSGHEVINEGDITKQPTDDFPVFASRVISAMRSDPDHNAKGILICGSGQGMAMAANRHKGIRASLCWNTAEAHASRNDDDANVLCLSARYASLKESEAIISTWLTTPFAGAARFKRRIRELDELV